jgi:hypothetical protein
MPLPMMGRMSLRGGGAWDLGITGNGRDVISRRRDCERTDPCVGVRSIQRSEMSDRVG